MLRFSLSLVVYRAVLIEDGWRTVAFDVLLGKSCFDKT